MDGPMAGWLLGGLEAFQAGRVESVRSVIWTPVVRWRLSLACMHSKLMLALLTPFHRRDKTPLSADEKTERTCAFLSRAQVRSGILVCPNDPDWILGAIRRRGPAPPTPRDRDEGQMGAAGREPCASAASPTSSGVRALGCEAEGGRHAEGARERALIAAISVAELPLVQPPACQSAAF